MRVLVALARLLALSLAVLVSLVRGQDAGLNDPTFKGAREHDRFGYGANATVRAIAVQSDGKILLGGDFTSHNEESWSFLGRVDSQGRRDLASSGATALDAAVRAIALQPDGKAIIGGDFTTASGGRSRIARMRVDGFADTTFNIDTGTNARVSAALVQPDGKAVTVGAFTKFNGVVRNRVARLNADGSVDAEFLSNVGANSVVHAVKLDASGLVLIGGDFTEQGSATRGRLARVLTTGGIDATFDPSGGANGIVYVVKAQLDGKLVIGGDFTHFKGLPCRGLARLNANGFVDTDFNQGSGLAPSATIPKCALTDLLIEPSGKLTVVGVLGS